MPIGLNFLQTFMYNQGFARYMAALMCWSFVGLLFKQAGRVGRTMKAKNRIAVVKVNGAITNSMGEDIMQRLAFVSANNYPAVCLQINTPGGSAKWAAKIHKEVKRLRDSGKRVVVTSDEMCCSAGVYIAAAADHIMCSTGCIYGSIGCIMQLNNTHGLKEKVGLKTHIVASGECKSLFSEEGEFKNSSKQMLQKIVDKSAGEFIDIVCKRCSKNRSESATREIVKDAGVFAGIEAAEKGLVDTTGEYEDALDKCRELTGIGGLQPDIIESEQKKRGGILPRLIGKTKLGKRLNSVLAEEQLSGLLYIAPFYFLK
jgi:protease-4